MLQISHLGFNVLNFLSNVKLWVSVLINHLLQEEILTVRLSDALTWVPVMCRDYNVSGREPFCS